MNMQVSAAFMGTGNICVGCYEGQGVCRDQRIDVSVLVRFVRFNSDVC
jgi:hypothetical protein